MAERTFPFEILTLQQSFLQQEVRFVVAPGQEGVFEVLPGHAPFVFALKPGVLRMRLPDGQDQHVAIGGGFLVVQPQRTIVMTRSTERPEQIDVERAQRAKQRAEERVAQHAPGMDVPRAQAALARAVARLKVAEYRVRER
jgi:F-type H+-transporting ATPase subunit epsilon